MAAKGMSPCQALKLWHEEPPQIPQTRLPYRYLAAQKNTNPTDSFGQHTPSHDNNPGKTRGYRPNLLRHDRSIMARPALACLAPSGWHLSSRYCWTTIGSAGVRSRCPCVTHATTQIGTATALDGLASVAFPRRALAETQSSPTRSRPQTSPAPVRRLRAPAASCRRLHPDLPSPVPRARTAVQGAWRVSRMPAGNGATRHSWTSAEADGPERSTREPDCLRSPSHYISIPALRLSSAETTRKPMDRNGSGAIQLAVPMLVAICVCSPTPSISSAR